MKDSTIIRPAEPQDLPFIFGNWLNHYKGFSYFAKRIRRTVFFDWHTKIANRIIEKPETRTFIAYPKDEPSVILGFLVMEEVGGTQVFHFCFVKREFRRLGIARKLYEQAARAPGKAYFTHWTYDLDAIIPKLEEMTYDPYRI